MAITFPSNPSTSDTFTSGNKTWTWNGTSWVGGVSTSGNAATLDSLDSTQFLRSDETDTMTGNLSVTGTVSATSFSGDGSNLTGIESLPAAISVNGSASANTLNIDASSNIGIGTTTPQYKLDIDASASNTFAASFGSQFSVGSWSGIHFGYSEHQNNVYRKSAIVFERTDLTSNDAQGKVHILNGPQGSSGNATLSDAKLTIAENGNVGIGTISPSEKLDVSGGVARFGNNITPTSETDNAAYFGKINGTAFVSSNGGVTLRAAGSESVRVDSNGNVLFGTTYNSDQGLRILHGSANRSWGIKLDDDETDATFNYIEFLSGGTTTTGGSVRGSIVGTSSGTTYNTTSDRRLKENIELITDGKEKILAMKPSTFNFIADETKTKMHGFVAQEMQEIVPEAVSDGTTMSMDYGRITPVIVAALQDALREIEQLKSRLDELEK